MVDHTRIGFAEVKEAARGQWGHIHHQSGIHLKHTNHRKHQACPGCGGKDRFRVKADYEDTGQWLCSGGGYYQSGDGFALLGHVLGLDSSD